MEQFQSDAYTRGNQRRPCCSCVANHVGPEHIHGLSSSGSATSDKSLMNVSRSLSTAAANDVPPRIDFAAHSVIIHLGRERKPLEWTNLEYRLVSLWFQKLSATRLFTTRCVQFQQQMGDNVLWEDSRRHQTQPCPEQSVEKIEGLTLASRTMLWTCKWTHRRGSRRTT